MGSPHASTKEPWQRPPLTRQPPAHATTARRRQRDSPDQTATRPAPTAVRSTPAPSARGVPCQRGPMSKHDSVKQTRSRMSGRLPERAASTYHPRRTTAPSGTERSRRRPLRCSFKRLKQQLVRRPAQPCIGCRTGILVRRRQASLCAGSATQRDLQLSGRVPRRGRHPSRAVHEIRATQVSAETRAQICARNLQALPQRGLVSMKRGTSRR